MGIESAIKNIIGSTPNESQVANALSSNPALAGITPDMVTGISNPAGNGFTSVPSGIGSSIGSGLSDLAPFATPAMLAMGLGGNHGGTPPSPPMPQQGRPGMSLSIPQAGAPVQAAGMMARQEPPSTGGPGMPRNLPPQVLQAMGMA